MTIFKIHWNVNKILFNRLNLLWLSRKTSTMLKVINASKHMSRILRCWWSTVSVFWAGASLVWVRWVQLHPQILRNANFTPKDFNTPILKHSQEEKKVQDKSSSSCLYMMYGHSKSRKWKKFHQPFLRKCNFKSSTL